MQRGHPARQPLAKAGEELRGEADLGNEHEHLAPAGDDLLDEPQVHLRLATAGDAVEHEGTELPEVRLHLFHRATLLGVEGRATGTVGVIGKVGPATLPVVQNRAIRTAGCIGLIGPALPIVAPDWTIGTVRRIGMVGPKRRVRDDLRPTSCDQCSHRPAPVAVRGRELRIRDAASVEHETEETALDGRATDPLGERLCSGSGGRVPHPPLGPGRPPQPQQPWQSADDDLADGVLEVSARPEEQLQHRRIEQRLRVDDIAHALETPRVDRARLSDTDYNPDGGGASERYPDARAGTHRRCRIRARRQVVERVPDRHRHRDLENRFGRRHPAAGARNRVRSIRESAEQVDIDP